MPARLAPVHVVRVVVVAAALAFAWEWGRDRGEVIEASIVAERREGKVWRYALEGGQEFAVAPIAGLVHGYPRVGDRARVRVRSDGATAWYAVAARYPLTVLLGTIGGFTAVGWIGRRARSGG